MPPQIWIVCDDVAYMVIERRSGGQHLISASTEDVKTLSKYRWTLHHSDSPITTDISDTSINTPMHRIILTPPKGKTVDHINGNRKDNRRENLRICTQMQNSWNRSLHKNCEVPFKGVSLRKDNTTKPYRAIISRARRKYELGSYSTAEDAARAYDEKAVELFGEFAKTNESMGLFKRRLGRILAMPTNFAETKQQI